MVLSIMTEQQISSSISSFIQFFNRELGLSLPSLYFCLFLKQINKAVSGSWTKRAIWPKWQLWLDNQERHNAMLWSLNNATDRLLWPSKQMKENICASLCLHWLTQICDSLILLYTVYFVLVCWSMPLIAASSLCSQYGL